MGRRALLGVVLVLAVPLAALLANYVYFRYRVACIEDECADEKAAIIAQVKRDAMKAMAERLASVREDEPPPASGDSMAAHGDMSDGFCLLVDATGDWVLVLVRSQCGTTCETRHLTVGLWTYSYDFEHPRVNFNLAGTRSGDVYRNDGHICLLLVPDEGRVEEFFRIYQGYGVPWYPISPDLHVERTDAD